MVWKKYSVVDKGIYACEAIDGVYFIKLFQMKIYDKYKVLLAGWPLWAFAKRGQIGSVNLKPQLH